MSGQNKQEAEGRSAAGGGDTGAQATQASAVDSTRPDGDTQPLEVDLTQPPRLRGADRRQLLSPMTIDDLLPPDHPARSVWRFVEEMDLSELYDLVRARGSRAGRPAIDPRVLVALWLYATLAGVTSARALADLCQHHDAYFWLAGGIPVNAHTLSDFRIDHPAFLQHLLEHSVNALRQQGLTDLDRVAQDGMRVRASAGAASFRSKETLEKRLKEAEAKLQALQQQMAGKEQPAAPQQPASQGVRPMVDV